MSVHEGKCDLCGRVGPVDHWPEASGSVSGRSCYPSCPRDRDTALARADMNERKWLSAEQDRAASESALASARATLEKLDTFVRAEMPGSWRSILLGIIHAAPSPAPVAAPCAGCEEMRKNWDACHRQHEQCMKLLARIQALLLDPNAQRVEWKIRNVQDLLREMLSNGALPEGWDE